MSIKTKILLHFIIEINGLLLTHKNTITDSYWISDILHMILGPMFKLYHHKIKNSQKITCLIWPVYKYSLICRTSNNTRIKVCWQIYYDIHLFYHSLTGREMKKEATKWKYQHNHVIFFSLFLPHLLKCLKRWDEIMKDYIQRRCKATKEE